VHEVNATRKVKQDHPNEQGLANPRRVNNTKGNTETTNTLVQICLNVVDIFDTHVIVKGYPPA